MDCQSFWELCFGAIYSRNIGSARCPLSPLLPPEQTGLLRLVQEGNESDGVAFPACQRADTPKSSFTTETFACNFFRLCSRLCLRLSVQSRDHACFDCSCSHNSFLSHSEYIWHRAHTLIYKMEYFLQEFNSLSIISDNAASPPVSRTNSAEQLPALCLYPRNNKVKKHHRRRSPSPPLLSRWESEVTSKSSEPTAPAAQRWESEINALTIHTKSKPISSRRTNLVRKGSRDLMPRMPSRCRLSADGSPR